MRQVIPMTIVASTSEFKQNAILALCYVVCGHFNER